ncbi:branched-chain amino acid ABC transporter permease [Terrarubrum flagellatum]|uniref:branched-chain amino acid ABC transporter permease n=1 Tax=Terrirubrum flagellatum TaxID=2895980 RepID=UPI0031455220
MMVRPAWRVIGWLAAFAIAIALPFLLANNYQLGVAHQALIFILLATGYNLLLGFTGLVSFGHTALFAIGAYASAIAVATYGAPFLVGLIAAALVSGVVGVAIAVPALRIKGHYLTLLTLALGEVIRLLIRSMESVTHGSQGFSGIPRPEIAGFSFRAGVPLYYLLLGFAVVGVLFVWRVQATRYGRAFKAVRDAEIGAEVCGVNTDYVKILAFGVSAIFAGVAGSLYAHTMRFISPEFFSLGLTITLLAMVLLGGRGTVIGPVVGAALLVALPEWLRFVKDYYLMVFGLAIWLCALALPDGVVGLAGRALQSKSGLGDVAARR